MTINEGLVPQEINEIGNLHASFIVFQASTGFLTILFLIKKVMVNFKLNLHVNFEKFGSKMRGFECTTLLETR